MSEHYRVTIEFIIWADDPHTAANEALHDLVVALGQGEGVRTYVEPIEPRGQRITLTREDV